MIKQLIQSLSLKNFKDNLQDYPCSLFENLTSSEKASLISLINNKNILIISGGTREDNLIDDLSSFYDNILDFPSFETLLLDHIPPSPDIIGKRMEVLHKLHQKKQKHILLCPLQAILQKVISPNVISSSFFIFKKSLQFDFDSLDQKLTDLGYKRAAVVSDKQEFALRGGILDIFPVSNDLPFRIEFFGDTIENIRTFDPANQKSIEKVDQAIVSYADELNLLKKSELASILDYLDDYIVIFDSVTKIENNYVDILQQIQKSNFFFSLDDFFQKIKNNTVIYFSDENVENLSDITFHEKNKYHQNITIDIFNRKIETKRYFHPFVSFENFLQIEKIDVILENIPYLLEKRSKIIFFITNQAEEKHLIELLKDKNLSPEQFTFKNAYLSSGFVIEDSFLVIIPYSEITHRHKLRRQKQRSSYHTPSAEFHHLEIGDLVVHFHSGIGKYLGSEKHLNHLGNETEFLIIEYSKGSKLYVPMSQAHLISRYIGSHDEKPILHALGSTKWQKAKAIAQRQIIGYASDLLEMSAHREISGGFVYPPDSEDTLLFEMDFPYIETQDQLKCIDNIKDDMTSDKPMDRLILGDVGFGKTEVAMRAAFKAVYDGKKQVAVLVPTTVLAMQHYETFSQRMASFPVTIDVVSRFKTTKQNKQVLENTKKGLVDILIGTHRILSKDVAFKDLGLIIIDEEQRFGVRAKEHLKKLKKTSDCITLSATPIPRTLYMSLINIKDMSAINTPPQDRLPIKTILAEDEDEIIKNALLLELSREGQSFFLHNRVESIYRRKEHIQKLLPNAKIAIAHGQMPSEEIDTIFHQFKEGEIDILFSTTIVENGIDIPNANTIIIDRADTFGLADLHQLRGRVGRWNKPAYCYFLTPKNKQLSEISQKRLNAMLESGGYGSGMKIAMRDLELRGAGDILGVKQSGQISSIGFHLYCKLLKRTIDSLKSKKPTSFIETKMEFSYSASIPEDYIQETNLRMEMYYRLGEASSFQKADEILSELSDRFGKPPEPVYWLIALTKIRIFANLNNFTFLKFSAFTLQTEQKVFKKTISKTLLLPQFKNPQDLQDITMAILDKNFKCSL